jgi:hypothetical protein
MLSLRESLLSTQIICFLLFCSLCECTLTIPRYNITVPIVLLRFQGTPTVVNTNISIWVTLENDTDYYGKYVLHSSTIPVDSLLRQFQDQGASGAIIQSEQGVPPGRDMYLLSGSSTSDLSLIAVDVAYDDYLVIKDAVQSESGALIAKINSFDTNVWSNTIDNPGMIVWQVTLAVIHLVVLVFSTITLVQLLKCKPRFKYYYIAPLICISEILSITLRFVYVAVDPFFTRRIFNYTAGQILKTISFPLGIVTSLLLMYYWHVLLTSKRISVSSFMKKLLWPFVTLAAVLLLLDFASNVVQSLNLPQSSILMAVNTAAFDATILSVAIWIFVIYNRVCKHLNSMPNSNYSYLFQVSTIIMCSGILLVLVVAGTVFWFIPSLYYQPVGYYTIWFGIYFIFTARGFLQILAVHPRFHPPLKMNQKVILQSNKNEGGKTVVIDTTNPYGESIQQRHTNTTFEPRANKLSFHDENQPDPDISESTSFGTSHSIDSVPDSSAQGPAYINVNKSTITTPNVSSYVTTEHFAKMYLGGSESTDESSRENQP